MTEQTNAELIAEARERADHPDTGSNVAQCLREIADALEAAERKAAELAAVIEQTEDFVTRHYLDMEMGRSLIEVLAIEPGGALREHDAALIEGLADEFAARLPDGTGNGRAYNSHTVARMLREKARQRREEQS